jgi:L-alanine-DL-glutamate epimerase-like enolase superfamily enzyme
MSAQQRRGDTPISRVEVSAYRVPTDLPEADGTIAWDSTTIVVVEATAGDITGLGYSYANTATADLIRTTLAPQVLGLDATAVPAAWQAMIHAIRNVGRPGLCSMAVSAVDNALWDLKARLFDVPLVTLLGAARAGAPVYGSGGFTTYSLAQLQDQLGGWVRDGIPRVKMKIGTHPEEDLARVRAARAAIGDAALYVDANGAYTSKQALEFAAAFAGLGVTWFEEPVYHEDFAGLRLIRDRAPAGMNIASGEYGYELGYFRRMVGAGAVDVVQADATRCEGITGFLKAAALCEAHNLPFSAHCAPTLHIAPCCAVAPVPVIEYFHDHARIEQMLFDGAPRPVDGVLYPDLTRPGLGLELKRADAERYCVMRAGENQEPH